MTARTQVRAVPISFGPRAVPARSSHEHEPGAACHTRLRAATNAAASRGRLACPLFACAPALLVVA